MKQSIYAYENPNLLPILIRLVVGVMFLLMGVGNFLDPDIFIGLLIGVLGLTGLTLEIVYWTVLVCEILAGIFVLLGRVLPKWIYKISLVIMFAIVILSFFVFAIPIGEQIWFHVILSVVLIGLFFQGGRYIHQAIKKSNVGK